MDPMRKIFTVFGATGNQGGSVCRSLIQNPEFHVRAITRNPDSDASKQLSALGIEVIKADGWKAEDMVRAFQGSWGAFVNTSSYEPVSNCRRGRATAMTNDRTGFF
jgi:Predicted nucleoside-diphosphate-sugar epimerases